MRGSEARTGYVLATRADRVPTRELAGTGDGRLVRLAHLERRVREALSFARGSRPNLRSAFNRLVSGLEADGATREAVARLVCYVVDNQAMAGDLNRPSRITGAQPADVLVRDLTRWVHAAYDAGGRRRLDPGVIRLSPFGPYTTSSIFSDAAKIEASPAAQRAPTPRHVQGA